MKAGDTIRRVLDAPWAPKGFEAEVILNASGRKSYLDVNGNITEIVPNQWELAPSSPVRTETITRTVIEPGVYGRLVLCKGADGKIRATLKNDGSTDGMWELLSALEWRELARIATELADGLDAQ